MRRQSKGGRNLVRAFKLMNEALGPQHWWPGETPFEIIVGAILTQSTAWTNVEKAIAELKREGLLSPATMRRVSVQKLAGVIRSSGYFNQKARRLKNFLAFLRRYRTLENMFQEPTETLRERLLGIQGFGPETADSILLYAGGHPVFVVDAYTRRILSRHGWQDETATYGEIQGLFESQLPRNVPLFNQYHALLVNVGKNFCKRKEPDCLKCPLQPLLPKTRGLAAHTR
jgi:endonuclease III related protein